MLRSPRPPFQPPPAVAAVAGDPEALRTLDRAGVAAEVRAHAVVELALLLARQRTAASLLEALDRVLEAGRQRGLSRVAEARLAHAEGHVRYLLGHERSPIDALNRAAQAFPRGHRLRPRVFDTLGQYFQYTTGDLDRARAYFELAYAEKHALVKRWGERELWEDLAITSGSLGRLELVLERWPEAEKWTRIDLDLEQRFGDGSEPARRRARASLHGQLARIALGRGLPGEALAHIDRALPMMPAGDYGEVYLWSDAARALLAAGDRVGAEQRLGRAEELARVGGFELLYADLGHLRAKILAHGVADPTHPSFIAACAELDDAMSRFHAQHQPQDECEVVREKAALLLRCGRRDEARRLILDRGIELAERSLFGQLQPLARLEALLGEIDPGELARVRARRTRGGIPAEEHTGRLRGERRQLTVWTCDIRGFAAYCDAHDDVEVVATLNRFFRAIGEPILDAGGCIDKYVGDNILAYFPAPQPAIEMALAALRAVDELNTEWQHLRRATLDIGVGIATGQAVVGNVGFAGKLEHTVIGSTVNLACRLVGIAGPREIAVDDATARVLGGEYRMVKAAPGGKVYLKGFGKVPAWKLLGRAEPTPPRRRASTSRPRRASRR